MKSMQGILFVGIALFLLWLGVTGRFEALIQALGVVRGAQPGGIAPAAGTSPATMDILRSIDTRTNPTIYPSPIGPTDASGGTIYASPIGPGMS